MFPLKDNIPTRRFPVLTIAIIVANIVMYFWFQEALERGLFAGPDEGNVIKYGAIPYEISNPGEQCVPVSAEETFCEEEAAVERRVGVDLPPTLVTLFASMFMHGGLLHLGGNMLFMWIFGNNIEDSMGRLRFVLFYVLGGVAALAAQTLVDPAAKVPTIGASGAVAAVLGAYAVLYPRARVITAVLIIFIFTLVELPAVLVLGLWFLMQLFFGTAELASPVGEGGGVAYFAHIGGFVFGLLLIKLFADRANRDYLGGRRVPAY